jgi:hypothetical protein
MLVAHVLVVARLGQVNHWIASFWRSGRAFIAAFVRFFRTPFVYIPFLSTLFLLLRRSTLRRRFCFFRRTRHVGSLLMFDTSRLRWWSRPMRGIFCRTRHSSVLWPIGWGTSLLSVCLWRRRPRPTLISVGSPTGAEPGAGAFGFPANWRPVSAKTSDGRRLFMLGRMFVVPSPEPWYCCGGTAWYAAPPGAMGII